jgi:hypothetical protein
MSLSPPEGAVMVEALGFISVVQEKMEENAT